MPITYSKVPISTWLDVDKGCGVCIWDQISCNHDMSWDYFFRGNQSKSSHALCMLPHFACMCSRIMEVATSNKIYIYIYISYMLWRMSICTHVYQDSGGYNIQQNLSITHALRDVHNLFQSSHFCIGMEDSGKGCGIFRLANSFSPI